MHEQRIAQWEEELVHKGIILGTERGKAEGRAEGLLQQKTTLLEMLSQRFGELPKDWEERVFKLPDANAVSRLMIALLRVKSAEEFGELLNQS